MLLVHDEALAPALVVAGLLLLGAWPAAWAHLDRRRRHRCHTFLDYSLTYTLLGVVTALTLGQAGPPVDGRPNFLDQLGQPNGQLVAFALAGGATLAVGDLAIQASVPLLGLCVGPPLINAVTMVLGVTLNYFLDGASRQYRTALIFAGAAAATLAIAFGAWAHVVHARRASCPVNVRPVHELAAMESASGVVEAADTQPPTAGKALHLDGGGAMQSAGTSVNVCLAVALAGGAVYSLFLPAFNIATNDNFGLLPDAVPPLSLYCTNFYFALSFGACSVVQSLALMYRPPAALPRTCLSAYFLDNRDRPLAVLSGLLAGLGDTLQFMTGQNIGYAAAFAIQAYPLASAAYSVLVLGEFRPSSRPAKLLLAAHATLYAAAVVLLVTSARQTLEKPRR